MKPERNSSFLIDLSTGLSDGGVLLVSVVGGFLSYQIFLQSAVGY